MKHIATEILEKTKHIVRDSLGWDFHGTRSRDFERGLRAMAVDLGIPEKDDAFSAWLNNIHWGHKELDHLTRYLTVGETYFFREPQRLELLKNTILPGLIAERRGRDQHLNIWSAGCCTGEEPYSIAIILQELLPDYKQWDLRIHGTDINKAYLEKAKHGIYTHWSFRETPDEIRAKYFSKSGVNGWQINPEIQQMVSFSQLNLADDKYTPLTRHSKGFDVIFCRNVLMYFSREQTLNAARKFFQVLTQEGWFILSAVEMNDEVFQEFGKVARDGCIVYRKGKSMHDTPVSAKAMETMIPRFIAPAVPTPIPVKPSFKPTPPAPAIRKASPKPPEEKMDPVTLFNLGLYTECIEFAKERVHRNPGDHGMLTLLVKSFANSGNLTEAMKWAGKLLKVRDADPEVFYLVATIHAETGHPAEAETLLKKALYLDPHHLPSRYQMAMACNKLGRESTAKKHLLNIREQLMNHPDEEIITGVDGLTAGRLREIVTNYLSRELK